MVEADGVTAKTGFPVLVVSTTAVDDHDTGPGHPERPSRLYAVERGLRDAGLADEVERLEGRLSTAAELALVHTPDYLKSLQELEAAGGGELDVDTPTSRGSWRTARWAVGSVLTAVEALDRGLAESGFVTTRPPGHHATASRGMGFCLLNTVAVAAATLAARGERVLVVDWDVHHGNGTQEIFWDDPRVLYASLHQSPAYPGTGYAAEVGGEGAAGLTVNVPLPPGATGDVALAAVEDVIAPVVDGFAPTWVLVSAGFDAHRDDPLADLMLSAADFADLTALVSGFAPEPGRVVAVLEGGYDLDGVARSAGATIAALAGVRHRPEPPTTGGPGRTAVDAARAARERQLGGHA